MNEGYCKPPFFSQEKQEWCAKKRTDKKSSAKVVEIRTLAATRLESDIETG
jgi:hypothetical protein